jgi:hypothetical protein
MRAMRRLSLLALSACTAACTAACAAAPARPETVCAADRVVAEIVAGFDAQHFDDTCKVWHRVYAPDGRLLSKGLGGDYPHHRGLFLGWNAVRAGGERFDFWHCSHGESEQLVALSNSTGCQDATIEWRTGRGDVLLREHRRLAASAAGPDLVLLDETSQLTACTTLRLDGDPQHAGCQFRALQQFAEPGAAPVRYLRPAGAKGGADDIWTDCAWIAAVLPFADRPVTIVRIEASTNPAPTRWSTRSYGRFGAMCTAELAADGVLRLGYRWAIALGELDVATCERLAHDYRGD